MDESAMGNYDFELIRHTAGKALVESDEVDVGQYSREELETVMWGLCGELSLGVYTTHPDERPDGLFDHRGEDDDGG